MEKMGKMITQDGWLDLTPIFISDSYDELENDDEVLEGSEEE